MSAKKDWIAELGSLRCDCRTLSTFRSVVVCGSFRKASMFTGLSLNTVRTHAALVERLTGRKLLVRQSEGVKLTKDGEAVLRVVEAMATARDEAINRESGA